MAKKEEMGVCNCGCGCKGGDCHRCKGWKMLVLGILVLLNAWYMLVDWWMFVGILITLGGLIKIIWPHCPHCK